MGDAGVDMKKYRELPSVEYLNECFAYDSDMGLLSWKSERPDYHFKNKQAITAWKTKYGGRVIDKVSKSGYVKVAMNNTKYFAHRLIWKMVTNQDPIDFEIDHFDANKSNNRISNLRLATRNENQHNRPKISTNKSGFKGVCWDNNHSKWRATISVNSVHIALGYFDNIHDAVLAYNTAADKLHNDFKNYEIVDDTETNFKKDLVKSNNVTGFRGVYYDTIQGKYKAVLAHNKIRYNLGTFLSAEEASSAYWAKRNELDSNNLKSLTNKQKYVDGVLL
jgi:hypothetical protein